MWFYHGVFWPQRGKYCTRNTAQGLENCGVTRSKTWNEKKYWRSSRGLAPDVRLGLYAPETEQVLPWELGLAAAENAASNGVEIS